MFEAYEISAELRGLVMPRPVDSNDLSPSGRATLIADLPSFNDDALLRMEARVHAAVQSAWVAEIERRWGSPRIFRSERGSDGVLWWRPYGASGGVSCPLPVGDEGAILVPSYVPNSDGWLDTNCLGFVEWCGPTEWQALQALAAWREVHPAGLAVDAGVAKWADDGFRDGWMGPLQIPAEFSEVLAAAGTVARSCPAHFTPIYLPASVEFHTPSKDGRWQVGSLVPCSTPTPGGVAIATEKADLWCPGPAARIPTRRLPGEFTRAVTLS